MPCKTGGRPLSCNNNIREKSAIKKKKFLEVRDDRKAKELYEAI
jgi:hypothetical protein